MKFVIVDHHLNKRFFVEKKVFTDLIKSSIKTIKNISLISSEVELENKETFSATLHIKKNNKITYSDAVTKIENNIFERSLLLIKSKPTNIKIIFDERNKNE